MTRCSVSQGAATPLGGAWTKGENCFVAFHRFPALRMIRRPCRRLIPKMLVHLGYLRGLIYSSDREQTGATKPTFISWRRRRSSPATQKERSCTSWEGAIESHREGSKDRRHPAGLY